MSEATDDLSTLSIGDSFTPLNIEDVTRSDFVKYAGASGDFNPIHTVEPFATDAGNPSVFGHGMLTAGFVSAYISNWFGIGNVTRFRTRFKSRLWPGDSVTVRGEITDKTKEVNTVSFEVSLVAENQHNEELITGDATVTI